MSRRSVTYQLQSAVGGSEPSLSSITFPVNGTITALAITWFVQEADEAAVSFGFEVAKNITAGGSSPVCKQHSAAVRDSMVYAHEAVLPSRPKTAGDTPSLDSDSGSMFVSNLAVPYRAGDVLNLGTYAPTGGNPVLAPKPTSSIRINVLCIEG